MASMIKKKCGLLFLYFLLINNLSIAQNNEFNDMNYKQLVSNDTISHVEIDYLLDIKGLIKEVCTTGCDDKGYTGDFSLKYSLKNKSFINLSSDTLIFNIPFVGYKCQNFNSDDFYTILKVELQMKQANISEMVKQHIIITRVNYNYPPLIEIVAEEDRNVEELSEIVHQIIIGYFKLYKENSIVIWNKEITQLSFNELATLKKMEPLNIRIIPLDGSLYCK